VILDSINGVASADANVAAAQGAITTLQAQLNDAQATLATAQAADTVADQVLSADLQANGPVFVGPGTDGTIVGYFFSPSTPGYTTQTLKPAGSTPNAPTPTPSPAS